MPSGIFIPTLVAAVGCGLVAGFFFAFSIVVMAALGRLPAPQGIAAMQSTNVTVINPWFMTAWFGTGAACLATIVAAIAEWDSSYSPYLLIGGGLYLVGSIGVTMAFNVPETMDWRSSIPQRPRRRTAGLATSPNGPPGITCAPSLR